MVDVSVYVVVMAGSCALVGAFASPLAISFRRGQQAKRDQQQKGWRNAVRPTWLCWAGRCSYVRRWPTTTSTTRDQVCTIDWPPCASWLRTLKSTPSMSGYWWPGNWELWPEDSPPPPLS